ncbi:YciE/YciF ferroxidase family protein [Sphingobacterium bovistauri]|uniref:Ferritin-like domain-containing protein n=1 Tax=Sphingobacterium bovistauri TaxID=2781959 RepID=A0ABS7Z9T7_9SPHI|nr:ferritin-like domain-containing protein [Sphingobacterium bovistauri]MCA5006768.1 ferritin-like domain-containing protein [Sphingobacterium bovistauri]
MATVKDKKQATKKASTSKSQSASKKKVTSPKSKVADAGKVPAKKDAAKNLQDLFEDGLKDIYWAEKALKKELPKMEKNASSTELKKAIKGHLGETEQHIKRLEEAFKSIGKKAEAEKCDAMAGLLEEGKGIIKETKIGAVRDAGIIAAAQKVEHYEIATYGTLAAFAKVLGHKKALKLLLESLKEEKKCDEALTKLADTNLNSKAE